MASQGGILEKKGKGGGLMEKMDLVILAILQSLGAPVHRTKLVKLIYLIDELFYRHFGRTMTGLQYVWDDFGPNAIGNAIVKEADRLASRGIIHIDPRPNYWGDTSYLYSLEQGKTGLGEQLPEAERYVIRDAVAHYGKYGVKEITRISKQTEPFKRAKRYNALEMNTSAEFEKLVEDVKSDPDFMKEIEQVAKTWK